MNGYHTTLIRDLHDQQQDAGHVQGRINHLCTVAAGDDALWPTYNTGPARQTGAPRCSFRIILHRLKHLSMLPLGMGAHQGVVGGVRWFQAVRTIQQLS